MFERFCGCSEIKHSSCRQNAMNVSKKSVSYVSVNQIHGKYILSGNNFIRL